MVGEDKVWTKCAFSVAAKAAKLDFDVALHELHGGITGRLLFCTHER